MKRIKGWESALASTISNAGQQQFQWGVFDCCLFVANAVRSITGIDIADNLRGNYNSSETALTAIKEYAGAGLAELCAKKATELSISEVPIKLAQRGDIILINIPIAQDDGIGQSIGIVGMDGRFALCASEKGLVRVAQKYWIKAWATR